MAVTTQEAATAVPAATARAGPASSAVVPLPMLTASAPVQSPQQPIAITVQMPLQSESQVHWSAAVAPFVALLAAAIAGYIGFRSWRTSRDKLKFDMFEMRFKVYEELMGLMEGWVLNWQTQKSLDEFNSIRQRAFFLFGDRVNTYLNGELKTIILQYSENHSKVHAVPRHKDAAALSAVNGSLKLWINGSRGRLKEVFIDDLKINH
ncbi:hypothetical protein ACSFBX_22255 [Variovorax sp. RB2P76]|uniref:hypothetical protein n=1 Tax=Variovorax sp. RB2P76 TaxID=3443736 RepID=UPI003F4469F8